MIDTDGKVINILKKVCMCKILKEGENDVFIDKELEYHVCSSDLSRSTYMENMEYIGKGIIYSIDGRLSNFKGLHHFWIRSKK